VSLLSLNEDTTNTNIDIINESSKNTERINSYNKYYDQIDGHKSSKTPIKMTPLMQEMYFINHHNKNSLSNVDIQN